MNSASYWFLFNFMSSFNLESCCIVCHRMYVNACKQLVCVCSRDRVYKALGMLFGRLWSEHDPLMVRVFVAIVPPILALMPFVVHFAENWHKHLPGVD